jgi:hypothetical protein
LIARLAIALALSGIAALPLAGCQSTQATSAELGKHGDKLIAQ